MWSYCPGPGRPDAGWLGWAYMILTTPCVFELSTLVINSVFLLLFSYLAGTKLWSVYHRRGPSRSSEEKEYGAKETALPIKKVSSIGSIFVATIALASLGSLVFLLVLLWRFWVTYVSNWNFDSIMGFIFAAVQFISWFTFAAIVGHEKKFGAEKHPASLRIWWIATFVLASWAFVSGLLQFVTGGSTYDPTTLDDVTAIVIFLISLFLLVVAIRGDTGLVVEEATPGLNEPLLTGNPEEIDH